MGGFVRKRQKERIPPSGVLLGGIRGMLQWKPKLIALVAVLVLIAALLGQFRWESIADQFTW